MEAPRSAVQSPSRHPRTGELVLTMWSLPAKRTLLAIGAALVLVGSVLGLALAQQGATPTPGTPAPGQTAPGRPGHQAFIDALARQLGITSERLQQAMTAARNEVGLTGGS